MPFRIHKNHICSVSGWDFSIFIEQCTFLDLRTIVPLTMIRHQSTYIQCATVVLTGHFFLLYLWLHWFHSQIMLSQCSFTSNWKNALPKFLKIPFKCMNQIIAQIRLVSPRNQLFMAFFHQNVWEFGVFDKFLCFNVYKYLVALRDVFGYPKNILSWENITKQAENGCFTK